MLNTWVLVCPFIYTAVLLLRLKLLEIVIKSYNKLVIPLAMRMAFVLCVFLVTKLQDFKRSMAGSGGKSWRLALLLCSNGICLRNNSASDLNLPFFSSKLLPLILLVIYPCRKALSSFLVGPLQVLENHKGDPFEVAKYIETSSLEMTIKDHLWHRNGWRLEEVCLPFSYQFSYHSFLWLLLEFK